ncbi:MAG: hypothetical protein RL481_1440, partial [Pseudomonadota bacterium]
MQSNTASRNQLHDGVLPLASYTALTVILLLTLFT